MAELSHEARELIARARPAERSDASAKRRVRTALAVHLAPPPAGPAAAGTVGIAASATKLVLICSLTAAGVVGTAAIVKTRHAANRDSASQPIARVSRPSAAPLAPLGLQDSDTPTGSPPATSPSEIARPAVGLRERTLGSPAPDPSREAARKVSLGARPMRAAQPAGLPAPFVFPEGASGTSPAPASKSSTRPPAEQASDRQPPSPSPGRAWASAQSAPPEPRPSLPSSPSSWRVSDLPTPTADRQVTRVTPTTDQSQRCSAGRELRLLSGAQAALREADGQRALDLLDQHAKSCPAATFWEERSAARVLALCLLHRKQPALAEAAQLATRAPRSPLLARLRSSCAAAAVITPTDPEGER